MPCFLKIVMAAADAFLEPQPYEQASYVVKPDIRRG